jgi:hypothetical protein
MERTARRASASFSFFPVATDMADVADPRNDPVHALNGLRIYALIDPCRMNLENGGAAIERLFVTLHCVALSNSNHCRQSLI